MSKANDDIKTEIQKTVDSLRALRDTAKLKMHLARMDAKDAWNKLEPRIEAAEQMAEHATEDALRTIRKTTQDVEKLIGSL